MKFKIRKKQLVKAKEKKKDIKVVVPDGVEVIGNSSFSSGRHVKEIELPNTVKSIAQRAFYFCDIEKINLGNSLLSIDDGAFSSCFSLKEIYLPESLQNINQHAFDSCVSLKKINIPPLVKEISYSAFLGCSRLEEIEFSDSIEKIEKLAFSNCASLKKVSFPPSLISIGSYAFEWCKNLKSIEFIHNIEKICQSAFSNCEKLEKIEFGSSLKKIEKFCFSYCFNLKEINFQDGLEFIGSGAFKECENLSSLKLPSTLKEIGMSTFEKCTSLKEVELPSELKVLPIDAFVGCSSLEKVKINEGLEKICHRAFGFCTSLKEIELPLTLNSIDQNTFYDCCNLSIIKLNNIFNLLEEGIVYAVKDFNYFYYNKENGKIIISKTPCDELKGYEELCIEGNNKASMAFMNIMFDDRELKKYRNLSPILCSIKNYFNCDRNDFVNKIGVVKEYNGLIKRLVKEFEIDKNSINYFELYKLSYLLGAFSDKQINRQKACEFIFNNFENHKLCFDILHSVFETLKYSEFNEELAQFFMDKNNFEELLKLEANQSGYICRICNNFMKIKEFGRSNRGDQHYRKVTVKMCKDYLSNVNFDNINAQNSDIAQILSFYTHEQSSFDEASKIRKEYIKLKEKNKIKDHLLKEELKEDMATLIDNERKGIMKNIKSTLFNLNEVANAKFSYEFLSKYDPKNFVLGKYCCCCAHLEGAGKGIMKASILHPDCQNLVIKNKNGLIVAKSTLYINRKQGYGLFNNIEINNNISEEDKKIIYQKYIKAIDEFVSKYNESNKENPIKQINVGMHLNDLQKQIEKNNEKSPIILKGLDFKDFGGSWSGDWKNEQYVLWSEKDSKRNTNR